MVDKVPRYGVHEQLHSGTAVDAAVESIRLLGYAVVDGNYSAEQMQIFSGAFDKALVVSQERHGGSGALAEIDEQNTIRALLSIDRLFLDLARNETILAISRRLVGDYVVLGQQNGIINPPNAERYNQSAFHRDMPYQHFVSSRPLAINALFCIDPFSVENGATQVIPASHKSEAFPSDMIVNASKVSVSAKSGSFIVLDCMAFHCGGVNTTGARRRAVNHVYAVPILRQQIELSSELGDGYSDDPDVRRFLGYDVRTPANVSAFYDTRRGKKTS